MTPSGIPKPATSAAAVLEHIRPESDLIVQSANGEPVTLLDAIEAAAPGLEKVTVHQGLPVHDRPYHAGAFGDRLHHVSYFLTPRLREYFERGTVDLMPNDLSGVPALVRARARDPLLLLSVSPPDRHGYVSLGTDAAYGAALMARHARLRRGESPHAAHLGAQPDSPEPRRGVGRGRLPAGVAGADRHHRHRPRHRGVGGRAHPRRRHAADRHRRRDRRGGGAPRRPSRPRHPHRALRRRPPTARRVRGGFRGPQARGALSGGDHVSYGSPEIYPFLDENRHI